MHAQVKHRFKKGFLLKEADIIKILEIINQRCPSAVLDHQASLRVGRRDNLVYTTRDLDQLRKEDNSTHDKIREIAFLLDGGFTSVSLIFEHASNVTLEINCNNRDIALLLSTDLKEYLHSEVLVLRSGKNNIDSKITRMIFPLLAFLVLMPVVFYNLPKPLSQDKLEALISTQDLHEKINFLIHHDQSNSMPKWVWIIFAFPILGAFLGFSESGISGKLFPTNVFYLGKQIDRYDAAVDLRSKIWWGIIVALVIGVLGSLIAWLLTGST